MEQEWKSLRLQVNSNYTPISQFVFVGFIGQKQMPQLIGTFFLFIYILTLVGNVFIFYTVRKVKKLHTPMFIMIMNLAASDIIYSTTVSPQIIYFYLTGFKEIQFHMCFVQMFFLHYAGSVDSYLMAAMAIDRFVSICYPLRYPTILSNNVAYKMCAVAWIAGIVVPLVAVLYSFPLPYCGPNKIVHLYCQHGLVARLACTDTSLTLIRALILAFVALLGSFFIILFSYLKIIIAVIKIVTKNGKEKAFYTCSTQLIIVMIYYIPRLFSYTSLSVSFNIPTDINTALGVSYCLLPPLVNPIIYSYRTKEIRNEFLKKISLAKIVPKNKKTEMA
ncbi:olfactory receptor 6N1-like [Erpetoichthys calabaricus]|uniref:olfactory receptor 6N1-like n=1 Tax=Erpetoichthys calabaricus TaxID=27687 RepID=UPI002233FC84|nr:olfactory receptor 6N1-like [Erpetoichthys calabaricus]